MECEICGAESEKLVEITIEGARVLACPRCAALGKRVRKKPLSREKKSTFFYKQAPALKTSEEPVQDFGVRVRQARERNGWKREELARKIFEKESVIHRIEAGGYIPNPKTIKKLEQALGVKLTEPEEE